MSLIDLINRLKDTKRTTFTGSMDIEQRFQFAVHRAIKQSHLSRWEIAGKMSDLLNLEITKTMLDSWTAESKSLHRFPAIFLPAFCDVVEDFTPIKILAEAAGVFVLPGVGVLQAELAKRIQRRDHQAREIKKIKMLINQMEEGSVNQW